MGEGVKTHSYYNHQRSYIIPHHKHPRPSSAASALQPVTVRPLRLAQLGGGGVIVECGSGERGADIGVGLVVGGYGLELGGEDGVGVRELESVEGVVL